MKKLTLFWFRRDLRLTDNAGLFHALKEQTDVLPLFIFDSEILNPLEDRRDARVSFIHNTVSELKQELQRRKSDLLVRHGRPLTIFKDLFKQFRIAAVYCNHDYEPSTRRRDQEIENFARSQGAAFNSYKDQTLFEKDEILSGAGTPYTVYTPYKNKILQTLSPSDLRPYDNEAYGKSYAPRLHPEKMLPLKELGFEKAFIEFPPLKISPTLLKNYEKTRDFPGTEHGTSRLGPHLRFGTVSVRNLARQGQLNSPAWLKELIWRDFFMQILWHFPQVEKNSFRPEYDNIAWRKSKSDFTRWCEGMTGYPLVDAGMRELNSTGYMHNRVRMVTASFLCKHLLIHWREGERYFAKKLLDFDLSANNGNWQWAAGSGCDAAPYFRVFNPLIQEKKFDPAGAYIQKWIPEIRTSKYPKPMVEAALARGRCLQAFAKALKK